MDHLANWIEIPVKDIARARAFYQTLLDGEPIVDFPFAGLKYALLPSRDRCNAGALVEGDSYTPSGEGCLIYLNATGQIDEMVERLRALKAEIILEKTLVSDEAGEVVLFMDPEGNRIGLQSAVEREYDQEVSDAKMSALLGSVRPTLSFMLRKGPRFGTETDSAQWAHARNMFTLMRSGTLQQVSVFIDGEDVLGFGTSSLPSAEALRDVLLQDPAVSCGRVDFEILTAMTFIAEKTDFREP